MTNKLSQMANGAIYTEDHIALNIHNRKLDALEDLIEQAYGKPVLVAYWFKHDLEQISKRLKELNILFEEIKTESAIRKWNEGKVQVGLIHPASAGHGLNLQSGCSTLIWIGLTWSLQLYEQTNARLYRQGQKASTVVIEHIITKGTINEEILKALERKDCVQGALKAYNKFVFNKAALIDDSKLMIETITDVTSLDEQISKQIEILENLAQKVKELVSSNASTPELQTDYLKEYDKLCTKHSIEEIKYKDLIKEKDYRLAQAKSMELFIKAIEDKPDVIDAWDDNLWILLIKKAIVHHDKSITFVFNNLSEITIAAE